MAVLRPHPLPSTDSSFPWGQPAGCPRQDPQSLGRASQGTPCLPPAEKRVCRMKDLIEYIARSLVDHPDQIVVREYGTGDRVRLELTVAREDMGRVIGKGGKVANAIRTMLRVAAEREGKQATLDVVEPE